MSSSNEADPVAYGKPEMAAHARRAACARRLTARR
jgi:hypothetical protein